MGVSGSTGNISTNGTITAAGNINGKMDHSQVLAKPTTQTAPGVYIGFDNTAAAGIELCSTSTQYIDFTIEYSDYKGRMIYSNTDSSFNWHVGGSATAKMTLNPPYMLAAQRFRQAIRV